MKKYESITSYKRRLQKLRIKKLGSGLFSTVYQHPTHSDVVVKLVNDDPMYIKYAKYCMAHPKNAYLPKVYSIHRVTLVCEYTGRRYHCHLVFLEKLQSAGQKKISTLAKDLFGKLRFTSVDYDEWRDLAKSTKDTQLRDLAKILYKLEAEDIHSENVMRRGDQLVFTDPVAS